MRDVPRSWLWRWRVTCKGPGVTLDAESERVRAPEGSQPGCGVRPGPGRTFDPQNRRRDVVPGTVTRRRQPAHESNGWVTGCRLDLRALCRPPEPLPSCAVRSCAESRAGVRAPRALLGEATRLPAEGPRGPAELSSVNAFLRIALCPESPGSPRTPPPGLPPPGGLWGAGPRSGAHPPDGRPDGRHCKSR